VKLLIFTCITGFEKSRFIKLLTQKCLEEEGLNPDLNNEDSKKFIHYIKFEEELLK